MNAGETRAVVRKILADAGIKDAGFEADQMILGAAALSRAAIHAHPEFAIGEEEFQKICSIARKRAEGAPLAYVLGNSLFCGRTFAVDGRVLIPRPETEILTEIADGFLKDISLKIPENDKFFADWCAGSGCIGITLLLENPGWRCFAVDSSAEALQAARENAASHGVLGRMTFIHRADPADAADIALGSLYLAAANPPYIKTGDISSLERQVRCYEPLAALDGGADGLDIYRILLGGLPRLMKPGGLILLETAGGEQADDILAIGSDLSGDIKLIKNFHDHMGIRRFMLWQKADDENKMKPL
jgi:release factor glutamine methyltransferase